MSRDFVSCPMCPSVFISIYWNQSSDFLESGVSLTGLFYSDGSLLLYWLSSYIAWILPCLFIFLYTLLLRPQAQIDVQVDCLH